jgi:7-carboxy-7-deazaguanine synthase
MTYEVAERFKSVQGEGVYTGTPMAFIRFVGCSVGKRVCAVCDTDFERVVPHLGGGRFTAEQLLAWTQPYKHICLTGGEPLDQDLDALFNVVYPVYGAESPVRVHIETSGTKPLPVRGVSEPAAWVCVSPKPGWIENVVLQADEVKVIVPGLGPLKQGVCEGWPTVEDALRWAAAGKIVFLQPRNDRNDVNGANLRMVQSFLSEHPELRLSVQLHKLLKVQ